MKCRQALSPASGDSRGWSFGRARDVSAVLEARALHGYPVVVERSETGFGAYAPDLPGCVATGRTIAETLERMAVAIAAHLEGMGEDGEPIPEPSVAVAIVGPEA
ncbi:MAG: type II toxin-antitoxin system HicB family antitoxin [Candidatus Dormibacteria bacterium]